MLPPEPSGLRSPLPAIPSLLAGFCPCWLGLPPTSPGLGHRGRTHRVSSHCRSTGRARAPQAEAAARLPHHRPPPSHPSSEAQAAWGGQQVFFPERAWLCESHWPRPRSLEGPERENMSLHSGHLDSSHPPEAGRCLACVRALCEHCGQG